MIDYNDFYNSMGQFLEMINNELIELNEVKKEELKQLKLANELKKKELGLKSTELYILNGNEITNLSDLLKEVDYDIEAFERELGIKELVE